MTAQQKRIFALCLLIALLAFGLAVPPNAAASENLAMVQMFEPDEGAVLPNTLSMIQPEESAKEFLANFIFYKKYHYGFPFFAFSALTVLPLQLAGRIGDMPAVMLALRQVVSVLPMLAGLMLLVYMHDRFRTYRSPALLAFLIAVPAVVSNSFWWHADSLPFLLMMLALFCLWRDNLRLGRYFLLAALFTGIATAAKLVGAYFFLAVGLVLVLAMIQRKASLKRAALMGAAFLAIMAATFLIANPFLLWAGPRHDYIDIFNAQRALLAQGYGVQYGRGVAAAWPLVREFYGGVIPVVAALAAAVWGALRGKDERTRLLNGLILAWFVPLTVSVFFFTHFKYQYWLPVALPLLSCLVLLLPERWPAGWHKQPVKLAQAGLAVLLAVQFTLFIGQDAARWTARVNRAENNPRIEFYEAAVEALSPLEGQPLHVYYDYRLYLPSFYGWTAETSYELLDYAYIQQGNFDVLMLLDQRIRDYLHPDAVGIDAESFARSQEFYRDADAETIDGYRLVYRDAEGLLFVREEIWQ